MIWWRYGPPYLPSSVHHHARQHGPAVDRPRLLYRYENIVQIRCLLEGITPEEILGDWQAILPSKMKEWKLDRKEVRVQDMTGPES